MFMQNEGTYYCPAVAHNIMIISNIHDLTVST